MTEISPEKQPNIEQIPLPKNNEAGEFLDAHEAQAQEAQNRRFFPERPSSANADKVAEALKLEPKEAAVKNTEHEESALPEEEWTKILQDGKKWLNEAISRKDLSPAQKTEGMIAAIESERQEKQGQVH